MNAMLRRKRQYEQTREQIYSKYSSLQNIARVQQTHV